MGRQPILQCLSWSGQNLNNQLREEVEETQEDNNRDNQPQTALVAEQVQQSHGTKKLRNNTATTKGAVPRFFAQPCEADQYTEGQENEGAASLAQPISKTTLQLQFDKGAVKPHPAGLFLSCTYRYKSNT